MKCTNCGSEMFEEDPGCKKCGWNKTSKQYGGTGAVSRGGLGSFFKSAITRPWLPVGDTYGVKVSLTAAFIVLSLTILYIYSSGYIMSLTPLRLLLRLFLPSLS